MSRINYYSTVSAVPDCVTRYDNADLSGRSKPLKELELDSLALIQIIFELKTLHNQVISDTELVSLSTIEYLIQVFRKLCDQSSPGDD